MSGIEKVDSAKYLSGPALGILKRHYSDDWLKFTESERQKKKDDFVRFLGEEMKERRLLATDIENTDILEKMLVDHLDDLRIEEIVESGREGGLGSPFERQKFSN